VGPGRTELHRADAADRNVLTGAAAPLLSLAAKLGTTFNHPDPSSLFRHVAQDVRNFEAAARGAGAPPELVVTARYALCTLLDEVVLNTPWGSQSVWANQTLLSLFHNEGWGGEKFFQILDRLLAQPAANVELLELMYLCMAMGLQGKYRIQPSGKTQIEGVQRNVLHAIQMQRGEPERELSPHWQGVRDARGTLVRYVPLWVVGTVVGGVVLLVYFALLLALNRSSDPVAAQVAALGREVPRIVERQAAQVAPRLATLLRAQIDRNELEVRQDGENEVVVLREGLFPSGSGDVSSAKMPLIATIGLALAQLPGNVLVTGHTDNVPIATLRFPSNWQLSQRRADAVLDALAMSMPATRLTAEGRADSEPVAANDTAANRALNRRVEITLLASPKRE
jgi:type VI secretion system protein ImpK